MFEQADARAAQRALPKGCEVALYVATFNLGQQRGFDALRAGQGGTLGIEIRRQLDDLLFHTRFVALEQFTFGTIKLDAVAVVGDVTARHHDRRDLVLESVQRDGWRRHTPGIDRDAAVIGDRLHHCAHDARRARAKITGNGDAPAALDLSLTLQILEEAARIDVT